MKNLGTLLLLLLIAATAFLANVTKPQDLLTYNTPLKRFLLILLILFVSSIISKVGVWLIQTSAKKKDKAELKQLTSVYKYSVVIILVFIITALLYGVIGPATTSIGLLAAGFTLALQRPITNLAGWFSIVAKRPYKIGDRVQIGNVDGYVHEISLMHTHLSMVANDEHTGKMAYVPNELVLTQPIVNYTKGSALVWDQVKVRIPATAEVKSVEKRLVDCVNEVVGKQMKEAANKWKVEVKPEIRVMLEYTGFKPHIDISVRYLVDSKTILATKSEITTKIIGKFKKELSSSAG